MPITKSYQLEKPVSSWSWGKLSPYSIIPRFFFDIFYFPLKLVLGFFFHLETDIQEDLKKLKGPIIIASSHGSWIDPFLVGIVFPFTVKIIPIHYATWWKYYYFPLFTPLIWAFGGFPVRKGVGLAKTLALPLKILRSGGTVGIFPTGKRTRKWNENYQSRPKRGAAFLALKANVPVLPVKIEGNVGMNFKGFLMRKYKIKVKIGRVFSLPSQRIAEVEDLNEPANYIMQRIIQL